MAIKKTYRMSDTSAEYLRGFAADNGLNETQALERILQEHRQSGGDFAEMLANKVMAKYDAEYYDTIKKGITLSCRFADKNAQILVELLNSLLVHLEVEQYCPTKTIPSSVYMDAVKNVSDTITAHRIHALGKKNMGNL